MVIGLGFLPVLLMPPAMAPPAAPPCPMAKTGAELAREAARELSSSRYAEAEKLSLCAATEARREGDERRLARILNNLGVARLYQQDFAGALDAFREAGTLSQRSGRAETEASVWSNVATLYGMLMAMPAAEEALKRALQIMPAESRFRPALLAQRVRMARGRPDVGADRFLALWREAMNEAERLEDWQVQRHLWDELADFYLDTGRADQAEAAVANSFRVVTLHRLTDPDSLWMLAGRLRLEQGRAEEALGWIRKLRGTRAGRRNPVSELRLAAFEAKAEAATRGARAALAACRRNWPRLAEWRQAVPPDPQVELASDAAMAELADLYAWAALAGQRTAQGSAEAWAVVEQSRALGVLRQRRRTERLRSRAGGAGGEVMVVPTAHHGKGGDEEEQDSLDLAGAPESLRLLRLVQGRLNARQALFCFWLGRERSLLWAVTREGFAMAELPKREALVRDFRAFRKLIEEGGDGGELAAGLYEETFGKAPDEARRRTHWLISADEEPLTAPLAALRAPEKERRHLGELRALTFVPSALWFLESDRQEAPRRLVAVGGLVHNSADPRFRDVAGGARGRMRAPAEAEFPSLPGSGREVAAISALWNRRGLAVKELEGFDATEQAVVEAAAEGATDLHFATHVQPAPEPRAYPMRFDVAQSAPELIRFPAGEPFLALSLERSGRRAGLGTNELHRLRLDGARVVLNGCSTGGGVAQRGAGLSSHATAWLAAGASSVVASLWPVDDDGTFFETYYRALLGGQRPAAALRAAQSEMTRSGSWRAKPRYWAAYIHLGKD